MAAKTQLAIADETMIRYADTKSPEEISFLLDGLLTPARVRSRITILLQTPDWLSATQHDQLVTHKMRLVLSQMEDLNFTTRTAEVMLSGLEKIGARLDKREAANEADLTKLYAFQGAAMLDSLSDAVTYMRRYLQSIQSPTDQDWDRAVEGGLRHAQLALSAMPGSGVDAPLPVESEFPETVTVSTSA